MSEVIALPVTPDWRSRLRGLVDPYSGKVINLEGLQCLDIRKNKDGRLCCEFMCCDGSVPSTSFFSEERNVWIHVNAGARLDGFCRQTTHASKGETMMATNPEIPETAAAEGEEFPHGKYFTPPPEKPRLYGPQGSMTRGWAKASSARTQRLKDAYGAGVVH